MKSELLFISFANVPSMLIFQNLSLSFSDLVLKSFDLSSQLIHIVKQ